MKSDWVKAVARPLEAVARPFEALPDLLRQLPELRVDFKAESTLRIIRGSCQSKRQLPERQLPEFRSSCQSERQLPDPFKMP